MDLPGDVEPVDEVEWEDEDDASRYEPMVREARSYLEGFDWCRSVEELHGGIAVPGVVAVFLARIVPTRPEVDEWLWVVVGDVPPAYLVTDDAPTSIDALEGYCEEMHRWVAAVRRGEPLDDVIPVNAEPTHEMADELDSRLDFLERELLPPGGTAG